MSYRRLCYLEVSLLLVDISVGRAFSLIGTVAVPHELGPYIYLPVGGYRGSLTCRVAAIRGILGAPRGTATPEQTRTRLRRRTPLPYPRMDTTRSPQISPLTATRPPSSKKRE